MRVFRLLIGTGVLGVALAFACGSPFTALAQYRSEVTTQSIAAPKTKPRLAIQTAQQEPSATQPAVQDRCLDPKDVPDADGDFTRNMEALRSPELCISYYEFPEGPLTWKLQVIRKKDKPQGPLWFIPHDNEDAAFDTAVKSVMVYGGTIVAVETGGQRLNHGQDPNRNFDAGGDRKCPQQIARSPRYTEEVLKWWDRSQPIIALHSNMPSGNIKITRQVPFSTNFPALKKKIGGVNPEHTLVFVASRDTPSADPNLRKFVDALNGEGVNVIYETVASKHSDCSLSNYASLRNIRTYLNVEVITGDSAVQVKIVNVIMKLLAEDPIGPRVVTTEGEKKPQKKGKTTATK